MIRDKSAKRTDKKSDKKAGKEQAELPKGVIAVANKLARIVWAVWKHERPFALMARAA
jgi:molybdopterin-biosynthesis enzyme MoeA-like protein